MVSTQPGTVAILGAGPAGLAAGYALARAGWSVQVYEQAPQVGGLARTIERDGFRFDIGGHRWYTKQDALNVFLIDLLGDELLRVERTSRIYFDGKYVDYPLRLGNVLSKIGPATSARALGDFLAAKAEYQLGPRPIVSMEDAYVAQFGRTLYELFFKRYSEKVWGQACEVLSGDWVAQRSRGLSLFTTLRDAIWRSNGQVESLVEQFWYPAGGYGRISERMAEEIERHGGQVHLGRRVVGLRHDGRSVREVTVSNGRQEQPVGADAFVSSVPLTELVGLIQPAAATAAREAAQALAYRAVITVHLMLNRPRVSADTWTYVHDPRVSFARLHEPRNWSPALAPNGYTSLVLELFCDPGDLAWERNDDELVAQVSRELVDPLRLLEPGEVRGGFVVRSRDAYPRYGIGYRERVETIKAELGAFGNLLIVGRGGAFRYINTDHAIETGLLAARRLLGEAVDPDAVNRDPEYLETRRVRTNGYASDSDHQHALTARG